MSSSSDHCIGETRTGAHPGSIDGSTAAAACGSRVSEERDVEASHASHAAAGARHSSIPAFQPAETEKCILE